LATATLLFSCSPSTHNETKRISFEVHEGTELSFDLSPDGKTIAFDLLGQIWLLSSDGGEAKAITNSIQENAEHLYPAFTADSKRIVFWDARRLNWGISSMDLMGEERRNLTELFSSYNDRFFACSPTNPEIAFIRDGNLMLMDETDENTPAELTVEGLPRRGITDPVWAPDGDYLVFVNRMANFSSHSGGRLWKVGAEGGTAKPLSSEDIEIRSPSYSPEGNRLAYFVLNKDLNFEIWVHDLNGSEPRMLTDHKNITPLRLKWFPEGKNLLYCAEGRLWKISPDGGSPQEIPFTAHVEFNQDQKNLKSVQFPKPEKTQPAKGHMGLGISPDGKRIAAIALGQLWIWEVDKKPVPVRKLPLSASGLCWSPDNKQVAWSAGVAGTEDIFITDVQSYQTQHLTSIPGAEVRVSWSPDGNYIAFVHRENPVLGTSFQPSYESLRVLKVSEAPVYDLAQTLELQTYPYYGQSLILGQGLYWGRPWSPDSRYLIGGSYGKPELVSLQGDVIPMKESTELLNRSVLLWEDDTSLIYLSNFLLWRSHIDTIVGISGKPVPLSQDAALYPSLADDGSVLYTSEDGLRIRHPDGQVNHLGWPLSFETVPAPGTLLIRNVRIIDGTGAEITQPCDILIKGNRISSIESAGQIKIPRGADVINGDGRVVIPGMIDAHMHLWDHVLLPGLLYEGVTTIREMGTQLAWVKGFQELVEAGIQAGPRVVLGGFIGGSVISPSLMDTSQTKGHPYGVGGANRSLSLARAYDFDFIKMYTPFNPYSGGKYIKMAHEQGFPVSSHAWYPLPLAAAGIDSKEHTNYLGILLGPRISGVLQDDIIQLIKESGTNVVPTISMVTRLLAISDGSYIGDTRDSPFLPRLSEYDMLQKPSNLMQQRMEHEILSASENIAKPHRAGVPLAAGTDRPFYWIPWGVQQELEDFVAYGLSPLEAIMTATLNAANVLQAEKDIGSIEKGKLADLVILDANPLEDIRNTRKIWKVIQGGKVVDRDALEKWSERETEEVADMSK